MISLEPEFGWAIRKMSPNFHSSFSTIYEKIQKWMKRFPFSVDSSVYSDLLLLVLQTSKQYLDQRNPKHLFRLILSMHLMQKKILRSATLSPQTRHLEIKWFQTDLSFPFCSRNVHGLLIGFNVTNRYEIFDEENILLALQKHLPDLRLVRDSFYSHTSPNKHVKIIYLELEKKHGALISSEELILLKENIERKVQKSIQTLSPSVSMWQTQEETYKNIIVLSNEITSLHDIPQVYITFDKQTGNEIVFHIILVQLTPFHSFSLKDRFLDCTFVSHRHLTVKTLDKHPIEALTFSLCISRNPDFLQSDGSLDFYAARQKVVDLLKSAIGEFRDYNGGIIVKQQHQLQLIKLNCPEKASEAELLENFFYELSPLENQITFPAEKISALFNFFLKNKQENSKILPSTFKILNQEDYLLLTIHAKDTSLENSILDVLQDNPSDTSDLAYNFIHTQEGLFFNCLVMHPDTAKLKQFLLSLHDCHEKWNQKKKESQSLYIGMEYSIVSLDPRIGGDTVSNDIQRLLFEGLTRFSQNGSIENAVSKSVSVSPCSKHYTFHLRRSLWNDGSPLTAYDFEYAWKKILSPQFNTSFAYFFYPIKNAKEAKQGKINVDEIGIQVIDDLTLKIELVNPTPYFLQLTAHPLYSPIHRFIDQQHPQWPNQCEQNYPCNGPFQLKMNRPNQGFKLVKNPFYFDAHQITLKEITLTAMNPSQAYKAFQNNELDWIGSPLGSWQTFFTPGKDDKVVTLPNSMVCWTIFNTSTKPFENIKLRKAFAYAIKRSKITDKTVLPTSPAYSPFLTQSREHPETIFPDYNPENAAQMLEEGLNELGLKKEQLPSINLIYHDQGLLKNVAISINEQLEECLGIKAILQPLPWNTLHNTFKSQDYQIGLMHWMSLVDDPIYTLNAFKSEISNVNFSRWYNQKFEYFISLSDREANPYQRSFYLLEAEKILCQEMPVVPLFYQPLQALVKKNIEISFKNPSGPFTFFRSRKT